MPHPVTKLEIIAALESNAQSIVAFFSSLSDPLALEGDADHWGPAHHLVHLTRANVSVERALRSVTLPLHPTARSRTYAEVRGAAASALAGTSKERLLEMGRTVVIASDAALADIVDAFASTSAELRDAASTWAEDALDRHALAHPLMGELTVREMLLFFIVHERHHLKIVRTRLESQPPTESLGRRDEAGRDRGRDDRRGRDLA
ncbi:MAG: DinB family protein [Candidatus Eisenbacteria bacterium]|uniref:DinB family protein n=1 Tax=Eiseniibacteriota bacterium TaxID=2212470 RepID=A0A538TN90_UNCEI|nr:MAG: DinB family protein [Candidatus Eisenbacteria bacterium]